ncbi:MAG: exosortase system-associated protein, TIGR04073 family [Lentisphaeria bacterium]|nr:exosortase system-associated protein, TIGR04073 family [Lentisphaeria bacterium]
MNLLKKSLLILSLMVAVGVSSAYAYSDEYERYPVWDRIIRKLGRGISNAAFGVCEFPIKWLEVNREEGGFAAITYGTFRALGYFVIREVVGVVEIVTFPVPLPGCSSVPDSPEWGYAPIIRPEWVITPAQDKYGFVYPELDTLK